MSRLDPVVSERLAATLALASQATPEKRHAFVLCRVDRDTGRAHVLRTVWATNLDEAHGLIGPQSAAMFVTSRAAMETMGEFPRSA